MEGKICQLQSEIFVTQNVNNLLQVKMDDNTQYSRRNCLIFDGLYKDHRGSEENIKEKVKESLKKDLNVDHTAFTNIDRAHRLPSKRNNKNSVIVKFKSFTDRNEIYKNRKYLHNIVLYKQTNKTKKK